MNRKVANRIATIVFYLIAAVLVVVLAALLGYSVYQGFPQISREFITSPPNIFAEGGGIGPQLFNSFYLMVLSMLMATPVALGAGIYLAEYAKKNVWTEWIRALIEMLASLPSIVIGIFIFLTFVVHMGWGFSILSGAVALAIFNMPLLVQVVEESVRSVPKQQKQAGLALGVSQWETIAHIVLPAALPEIVTGMILGAGRVFGEAGALIYTAGMSSPNLDFANWNPFSPSSPLNPMRPAETLAVHIWKVNGESIVPDAEAISSGATLLLILSIFICNISARIIGAFVYRRLTSSSK
ncbi:phosphate transport system permease protein [Bacillus thermophilus]|uniref:Phosphate transport system permease protein PstA n=1 Tax=Siminovitchia thermophila TaxID=1245522 RepID=A0ABS2R3X2_9BACI|nr:phosphate ABC transporter permease PstA [Siminovitchia thermophila]MBM7713854.1 phosphate transport system permease protein [Siminovitchia thermophila]ONK22511.1 phosphate ABC transporter, permease protein PstA [Bacillus sp. VT-16-64]